MERRGGGGGGGGGVTRSKDGGLHSAAGDEARAHDAAAVHGTVPDGHRLRWIEVACFARGHVQCRWAGAVGAVVWL